MISIKVEVKGIVQGVGFRPFVYNLALKHHIKGWVNNDEKGVNILLYSSQENINLFIKELQDNPPILAKIDSIKIEEIKSTNIYKTFEIKQSQNTNNKSTIISPDIAICEDCIKDINDKNNFRHNYALTNCTNCGPRYSIIKTLPYDRENTSMSKFLLCEDCKKEYKDPTNRRYHAQPVSCKKCGPNIGLYNKENKQLSRDLEAIKQIAQVIKDGKIVAIKGLGGFHLICDANNDKAVEELRLRKNRPNKPFALMFKNIESIKEYAIINKKEEELLISKEKPIVLVHKKKQSNLSKYIAPNINRLGCFISYTPLHHILFKFLDIPLLATSANLKDEPIIVFKDELIKKLAFVVDYVLDYNREIINACDDSVIQVINNDISKLRNARGYTPSALKLKKTINKKILALGANQKSTISIAFEDNLIVSPHIGDLNSIEAFEYYIRTIETFKRFYDFEPEIIVCDKHPNYENVKWAKTLKNVQIVQVQHHYAHILSTMAEYNLKEEVLAFAFDGTGYGDDGNIWGGEVFVCDNKEYTRSYHLKYFSLLGGEKAVKEPKRIALALLFEIYTLDEILSLKHASTNIFTSSEIKLLHTMWIKGLNSPQTSSMGRLFDAIASFADILHVQSYEGESGLQIEQCYDKRNPDIYSYEIIDSTIDLTLMIKQILKQSDKKVICTMFINTIANIIINISNNHSFLPIVLSGGVFQNKTLLELITSKLDALNKTYYYSKEIPLNDGGISVGQIYHLS